MIATVTRPSLNETQALATVAQRLQFLDVAIPKKIAEGKSASRYVREQAALLWLLSRAGYANRLPAPTPTPTATAVPAGPSSAQDFASSRTSRLVPAPTATRTPLLPSPSEKISDDMPVSLSAATIREMTALYRRSASVEEIAKHFGTSVALVVAGLTHAGYSVALNLERPS